MGGPPARESRGLLTRRLVPGSRGKRRDERGIVTSSVAGERNFEEVPGGNSASRPTRGGIPPRWAISHQPKEEKRNGSCFLKNASLEAELRGRKDRGEERAPGESRIVWIRFLEASTFGWGPSECKDPLHLWDIIGRERDAIEGKRPWEALTPFIPPASPDRNK